MIDIDIKTDGQGTPEFSGTLKRINIFLGTNGSGKSKLLKAIAVSSPSEFHLVPVSGSRTTNLPQSISAQSSEGKIFSDLDEEIREEFADNHLRQQQAMSETPEMITLEQYRLNQALNHFSSSLASEKVAYRKKHIEWMVGGGINDAPVPPEERDASFHLDRLFSLFNEIFPEIRIRVESFEYKEKNTAQGITLLNNQARQQVNNKTVFDFDLDKIRNVNVQGTYSFTLICSKQGHDYPPQDLSDGEKQILALLADRYFFRNKKCLFLIDEPELNLDPVLAMKYWSLVERELDHSVFVYTTHSLDFALREGVDRIWSLGSGRSTLLSKETLDSLPSDDQRRFLSGIRGIVAKDRGLIIEGDESSFDSKFYPWLLGRSASNTQISGYGSCNDVEAATRNMSIWQSIVPSTKIIGIVDRDYKTDDEIQKLTAGNCLALDFHDAEAYVCFPALLVALARKMGRPNFPSEQDLVKEANVYLTETLIPICHHRMARKCRSKIQISLRSDYISKLSSIDELKDAATKLADQYSASEKVGPTSEYVSSVVLDEYKNGLKAKNDINEILRLVNGKALLDRFARHLGLVDGIEVMNYVSEHLSPSEFPHTQSLQRQIQSEFLKSQVNQN